VTFDIPWLPAATGTEKSGARSVDVDALLVDRAAGGDRDAFDELVRRYQARIFNLARALTANGAEAEDLAQEAFVRAFRGIRRFRGDSSFRTWLYRIAVNVIYTHLGRRQQSGGVWQQAGSSAGEAAELADPGNFEDDLVRREAIDIALSALPEDQRIAVVLRDVEGFSYREIAEATGTPLGTVESRIFRARERLREALAPMRRHA
jgi:RNA polymerase sigma-70 factor, ECF subfamily